MKTIEKESMNGKLLQHLEESFGVGQGKIRYSVLNTLEETDLDVNIGSIKVGVSNLTKHVYPITDGQAKL